MHLTRRRFIATSTLAACGGLRSRPLAASSPSPERRFLGFSKPFLHLDPTATADLVSEVGWDGIDCPVRATLTHIRPERIADDLPPLIEALKRKGKTVDIVTTDIVRLDARSEGILRTLAKLGIGTYRLGFVRYRKDRPPEETLREFSAALRDLAALNRELGLRGGYQNHSGSDYVGATTWELWQAINELDPVTIGLCFDIGQTMVEGGLSWPTQTRLLRSRWFALQVKDFIWDPRTAKGWDAVWVPLGHGRVSQEVLHQIGGADFAGPVVQHHEHLKPRTPVAELLPALKQEFTTLRAWLP